MIGTEFLKGQGLGNRLFCYVSARCIALDHGQTFGTAGQQFFHAEHLDVDPGTPIPEEERCVFQRYDEAEERIILRDSVHDLTHGCYIAGADPVLCPGGGSNFSSPVRRPSGTAERHGGQAEHGRSDDAMLRRAGVPDFSRDLLIYGNLQDESYFGAHRKEIRQWLRVKPAYESGEFTAEDLCVINVRGGEYADDEALFLRRRYYLDACRLMQGYYEEIRSSLPGGTELPERLRFLVVTDDEEAAHRLLPGFAVHHFGPEKDYVTLKNARYLILSNSSFGFFPAYTSETVRRIIAPKYWARHNSSDGFWASEQNIYQEFLYLGRDGRLCTPEQCRKELSDWRRRAQAQGLFDRVPASEGDPEVEKLRRQLARKRLLHRALWKAERAVNPRLKGSKD